MSAIDEFLILFRTQVQDGGLNRLNSKIKTTRNELFSMKNLLRGFIGYDIYTAVRSFIPSMIDTARQLGAMHARFFAITNDSKLASDEFDWLTKQTQRLGLELMNTADNYSIFFATAKNTLGTSGTREVYSNMLEAIRVLHITPEKMGQIFYAFREIASEGTVKLQRITRQLGTSVPDAMNIAAKSMGYAIDKAGISKFRDDISAAKIDSKTFLMAFSRGVKAQYVSTDKLAMAMSQVDAQIQILQNSWQLFQIKMSKAGFSDDLIKMLKHLNVGMAFIEKHAHGIYKAIKLIGGALLSVVGIAAFGGIVKFIGITAKIISMTAAVRGLGKAVVILQALGMSTGSMGVGMSIILAALTNPYVLGAILITGLVIALGFITKKFFPNIYNDIMAFWLSLRLSISSFMQWLPQTEAFQILKRMLGLFGMFKGGVGLPKSSEQSGVEKNMPQYEFLSKLAGAKDLMSSMMPGSGLAKYPGRMLGAGLQQTITNMFQPSTKIDKIEVHTNSDNAEDIAEKIKQKLDERDQKNYKSFGDAVAGSKASSYSPFTLSKAIY